MRPSAGSCSFFLWSILVSKSVIKSPPTLHCFILLVCLISITFPSCLISLDRNYRKISPNKNLGSQCTAVMKPRLIIHKSMQSCFSTTFPKQIRTKNIHAWIFDSVLWVFRRELNSKSFQRQQTCSYMLEGSLVISEDEIPMKVDLL